MICCREDLPGCSNLVVLQPQFIRLSLQDKIDFAVCVFFQLPRLLLCCHASHLCMVISETGVVSVLQSLLAVQIKPQAPHWAPPSSCKENNRINGAGPDQERPICTSPCHEAWQCHQDLFHCWKGCLWNSVRFNKEQQNNFYPKNAIYELQYKDRIGFYLMVYITVQWNYCLLDTCGSATLYSWNNKCIEGPGSFHMCIWRCL